MENFRDELREHILNHHPRTGWPTIPVTVTGHPRAGLTVAFRPSAQRPAGPEEIIRAAAEVGASAGVGAGVFTGAGVIIGKFVFGTIVTRAGVASAGVAFGVPILAPIAIAGGVLGSIGYGIYRFGRWRRAKELAEGFAKDIIGYMDHFSPSSDWPSVETYISLPEYGLSVLWRPEGNR